MDLTIVDLAAKVMAVLLPFVSKGAEEFANKVGDAAYEKAAALLCTLKKRWSGDPVASADLTRFEEEPDEVYQVVLKKTLQKKLTEDKGLVAELSRLLQEMGPTVEIIQRMDEGRDITGLKAKEIQSGRYRVAQAITKGERITGADLDISG